MTAIVLLLVLVVLGLLVGCLIAWFVAGLDDHDDWFGDDLP